MNLLTNNKVKKYFLSNYCLVLSLSGILITSYIFEFSGTGLFIGITAFFLFIQILSGSCQKRLIPITYWILSAISLLMVFITLLFSFDHTDTVDASRLVKSLIIVFAIYCISKKGIDEKTAQFLKFLFCILILCQYIALKFLNMPYGTFSNKHYLASFAVLSLPIAFYYLWETKNRYKAFFIIVFFLNLHILFSDGYRPAIVGIFFSTLIVILLLAGSRIRWFSLSILLIFIVILSLTDYLGVYSNFEDLFVNLRNEERWVLWKAGWDMLLNNSIIEWIFGNGLGSNASAFKEYSKEYISDFGLNYFTFPHFHVLEIIYENGIFGAILIFGGLSTLLYSLFKKAKTTVNFQAKVFGKCLIVMLLAFLFHSSMTFGFYSKHMLYPLSFIIGFSLVTIDIGKNTEALE